MKTYAYASQNTIRDESVDHPGSWHHVHFLGCKSTKLLWDLEAAFWIIAEKQNITKLACSALCDDLIKHTFHSF